MSTEKRLIDANALKREIVDFKKNFHPENYAYGTGYFSALSVVEGMLAYAPTVDAVEVVRCKDCKWRQQDDVNRNFCGLGDFYCGETDFCSRGERRTDG